jgi:hypothetical protein
VTSGLVRPELLLKSLYIASRSEYNEYHTTLSPLPPTQYKLATERRASPSPASRGAQFKSVGANASNCWLNGSPVGVADALVVSVIVVGVDVRSPARHHNADWTVTRRSAASQPQAAP